MNEAAASGGTTAAGGSSDPTDHTCRVIADAAASLPPDDGLDLERCRRGLIARLDDLTIRSADGQAAWSLGPYGFLGGEAPDSAHPSLWRMAQLLQEHGLFEVVPGLYQVRGYDAANMTVVEGDSGYVVIDPLMVTETAEAAMGLVKAHLGDRPVTAVVYTHSHLDHFGGVTGVLSAGDARDRNVPIVAPHGFLREAVSENVYVGKVMQRRGGYQMGTLLPRGPRSQICGGLAVTTPLGTHSLIPPTILISQTPTEHVLDGVRVVFQYTPDSEAPAELVFHLPDFRALCMAEILNHAMHNLYTLRGAQVRDALAWSGYVNESLHRFGNDTDTLVLSHLWPIWGHDQVVELLEKQRDLYRYIHDQTLRYANYGYTGVEIAERLTLPPVLDQFWANRGVYGALNHNVKAVYQRYLGWFDANPANLHQLPPVEIGRRWVAFAGGAEAMVRAAESAFELGDYRWCAELLKHVLFAEPDHQTARELQARVFDQLGYQAESGPWRNFYLMGAHELRHGVKPSGGTNAEEPLDLEDVMTVDMVLDFVAIRLNGPAAAGTDLDLGLHLTDDDETYQLTVKNGALSYWHGDLSGREAAVVTLGRRALIELSRGRALDNAVDQGACRIDGDRAAVRSLFELLDEFPNHFHIVNSNENPPTDAVEN